MGWLTVDGLDATRIIADLLRSLRTRVGRLDYILTDTIIFAGLNILDPFELSELLGLAVISVFLHRPRLEELERALRHVPYSELRLKIVRDVVDQLVRVECPKGVVYLTPVGASLREAWSICCELQVFSRVPEPLHAAGVIASALVRAAPHKSMKQK